MRQAEVLEARSGRSMKLVHVGARREHPDHDYGDARVSRDVMALAEDPEIDVLVELIGGTSATYDLIKRAIQQGKHIVTANKALIAEHGGVDRIGGSVRGCKSGLSCGGRWHTDH